MSAHMNPFATALAALFSTACLALAGTALLEDAFRDPPDSARPGVYWYFLDGNLGHLLPSGLLGPVRLMRVDRK